MPVRKLVRVPDENTPPCSSSLESKVEKSINKHSNSKSSNRAVLTTRTRTQTGLHTPPTSQSPPAAAQTKSVPLKASQKKGKQKPTAPATEATKKRVRRKRTKARPSETLDRPPECADSDSDDPLLIKSAVRARSEGRPSSSSAASRLRYASWSREPSTSRSSAPPERDSWSSDGDLGGCDYYDDGDYSSFVRLNDSNPVQVPLTPRATLEPVELPLVEPFIDTQVPLKDESEPEDDHLADTEQDDDDVLLVPLKGEEAQAPPSPFANPAALAKRPPSPHPNVKRKPRRSTTPLDPALASDEDDDAETSDAASVRLTYADKQKWPANQAGMPSVDSMAVVSPSPARQPIASKIPTPNRDVLMASPSPQALRTLPLTSSFGSPRYAAKSPSRIPVLVSSPARNRCFDAQLADPRTLLVSQFKAIATAGRLTANQSRSATPGPASLFDDKGNPLVQVSSADPTLAKKAAAILTKYHRYKPEGNDGVDASPPRRASMPGSTSSDNDAWSKQDWKRLDKIVELEAKRFNGIGGSIDERRVVRAFFELEPDRLQQGEWSELKVRLRVRALLANRNLRRSSTTPQSASSPTIETATDDFGSSDDDDDDADRNAEDDTFFERGPNYRIPSQSRPTLPLTNQRPSSFVTTSSRLTPPPRPRPSIGEPPSSLRRAISYLKSFIPRSPAAPRPSSSSSDASTKPDWTQIKLKATPIPFADTRRPFETRLVKSLPARSSHHSLFASSKKSGRVKEQASLFEKLVRENGAPNAGVSLKRSASEADLPISSYAPKLPAMP